MRLIDNFKGMLKAINQENENKQLDLARTLRKNALGLEYNYGSTQFVKRIRIAADAIEDMENTLLAITLNSKDQWAIDTANEALDRLSERRI